MFKKIAYLLTPLLVLSLSFGIADASAYEVPNTGSEANYFYVFGPEGDPLRGKEDSTFTLYVDVPKGVNEPVVIGVYDPDTSGKEDAIGGYGKPVADTETKYTVEGKSVLASETFGAGKGDGRWVDFGPFSAADGQDVGDANRFRLTVTALNGDDQNLFKVRIRPDAAASFSENVTFRLLPKKGQKVYFYPEVPAGVNKITARNFDLDADGGKGVLKDAASGKKYDVADSTSGNWQNTNVNLGAAQTRRLQYEVTTTDQTRGNAGVQFLDDKGRSLPIYFRKGQAPAPAPGTCNTFVFDATQSYDPNNDAIDFRWDFGDGSTSDLPVVEHVYAKGGKYPVTLTVTDNSGLHCQTATTRSFVEANTPPTAAIQAPTNVCINQPVTINGAASSDNEQKELSYAWSFSDGTSASGKAVTKTFDQPGRYDVGLTVNDNSGSTCAVDSTATSVMVGAPPVAMAGEDIALCLTSATAEYGVTFDGGKSYSTTGSDLVYSWDFGDGSKAEGQVVNHVYSKPGEYTARLTVRDASGSACGVATDTVKVMLNKSPVADAGQDITTCENGNITLTAGDAYAEAGETVKYMWDFGDGTTGTGKTVTHKYDAGYYTATLTVDDGKGSPCSTSIDTANISINTRPTVSLQNVDMVCAGENVVINAVGSSEGLKYTWDLGDGTMVEGGSSISHAYSKGGNYRVRVKADNGAGDSCGVAQAAGNVKVNSAPIANAGPNLVCCTDEQSQFDGSKSSDPDGDKLSYSWNYGDGGTGSGPRVTHEYSEFGQYQVSLTVDDGKGTACSTASSGFIADVNARPVPVIAVRTK